MIPLLFAALLFFFVLSKGMISRFLNSKIPSKLGAYSYEIYLFQGVSFVLFNTFLVNSFSKKFSIFSICFVVIEAFSLGIIMH